MGLNITLCATSTLPCSCISGVSVKFQACHWPFPVSLRTWRCWCCCWGRMLDEKIGAGLTAHWSHPPATPNWAGGRHWISTSHWPPYSGTRDIWDSSMNQGFLLKANFFCVHNMSSFMHLLVEKTLEGSHILLNLTSLCFCGSHWTNICQLRANWTLCHWGIIQIP